MSARPDSLIQANILLRLRRGERLRPIVCRRHTATVVMIGFGDNDPAHAGALGGLVARGVLDVLPTGQIIERKTP